VRAAVRIGAAHARAGALRDGRGGDAMRKCEIGVDMSKGALGIMKANGKIAHANTNILTRGDTVGRTLAWHAIRPFA
jgi:hypothetical protein